MGSEDAMARQLHSFSWNHHRQTFFNTVLNLRKEEMFCDITLACDGSLFPAHRLVLAMCSEYFCEILTKVSSQQPMVLLVPAVGAADMEALLKYIYQGEIRISQTNLPSLMQAAQMLKIKGLSTTNNGVPWEEYTRPSEDGGTTAAQERGEESNSFESVISVPPEWSIEKPAQDCKLSPQQWNYQLPDYPQVEVFIHEDETDDMNEVGEETEEKEEVESIFAWTQNEENGEDGEEDLDPLSVPLPPPHCTTFTPDFHHPVATSHVATIVGDSDSDIFLETLSGTSTATPTPHRYTKEQKLQMWSYYHTFGPVKTARLMSEQLGRKMNESSVRSVVKALQRRSKEYDANVCQMDQL